MTTAKVNHKAARALLLQYLDLHPGKTVDADLDPAEVGIVGDTSHAEGGDSYHLGKDQIKTSGHRYSVDESSRDKRGLDNFASAMDVGYFRVTTWRATYDLRDYSVWLVGLCKAGDPDTKDLREVIYSPDGKTVHRWDREGIRTTGDSSHLYHTHLSEYRDADGHRMIRLATRWLQHIGLIPEEDDLSKKDALDALEEFFARGKQSDGTSITSRIGRDALDQGIPDGITGKKTNTWAVLGNLGATVGRLSTVVAAMAAGAVNEADIAALKAAVDQVDEQVAARLVGDTPAETAAALRAVLGDQAAEVGRLLAGQ